MVLEDGAFAAALFAVRIADIIAQVPHAACVGVDIPIGAEPDRFRRVDATARDFVGKRRSSVFQMPPAGVLEQPTYREALALSVELGGKGLSRQSYALREKVAEVAAIVAAGDNIIEVHPEVSFRAMAGAPLQVGKAKWAGQCQRRALLEAAGIVIPSELGEAGVRAAADDVLDAAAVAWSAQRHALGQSVRLEPVCSDDRGRQIGIWY